MTSIRRTILPLAAVLLAAGSCSVSAPRDGRAPGPTAASGKRKIIDLDELAIAGVALKEGPRVAGAETRTTGLTRASILAVVRAYQAPLRACYQQGLARDPDLAGTVVLRFDVDAGGSVQNLSVSRSTLASPEVAQCVLQIFARIPFPRPEGRTTVTYPLTFRATP
jgi:TonB family protein